jgi:hypothetical protein
MKKSDKSDSGGRRRQQASSSSAAAALQQHGFATGALTFASFSGGSTQSPGCPSPSDSESGLSAALDPNVALFLKQVWDIKVQTYKHAIVFFTCCSQASKRDSTTRRKAIGSLLQQLQAIVDGGGVGVVVITLCRQ